MGGKLHIILFVFLTFITFACKKGKGAICMDGHRSHSTGRGTCSWHGGVDYYVNPDEIDVGNTIWLIVIVVLILYFIISSKNAK